MFNPQTMRFSNIVVSTDTISAKSSSGLCRKKDNAYFPSVSRPCLTNYNKLSYQYNDNIYVKKIN